MKGVKIMTEREFLTKALHFFYKETWPEDYENMIPLIEDKLSSYIPKFLTEFHKEYYEVEFVKKKEMDKFYQQMHDELMEEIEAKEGINEVEFVEIKEEKFVFPPAGIHGLE
jgi:hypothetical protein